MQENLFSLCARLWATVRAVVVAHRYVICNFLFFCLVAYPAAVAVGMWKLFDRLVPCHPIRFTPALRDDVVVSAAIRAEYIWGTSVVLLIMAGSWTVVHCGRVILRSQPRKTAWILLGVAIGVSATFAVRLLWPPLNFYNCVSATVFKQTMTGFKSGYREDTGLEVLLQILASAQIFGAMTATFIAVASISVLTRDSGEASISWQNLEARASRLRSVLYAGALGLVTFFLQLQAMFAIPEALLGTATNLASKPDVQVLKNLAEGLKIFWGSTLTLLLASIYVPAAVILRQRSLKLARQENPDGLPAQIESWMRNRGLMESWTTQLAKALAILSPLLSGPLAALAANLAGVQF